MGSLDDKCKDCSNLIYSSEGDFTKWKKLVESKPEMSLPKRCKACRDRKRMDQVR